MIIDGFKDAIMVMLAVIIFFSSIGLIAMAIYDKVEKSRLENKALRVFKQYKKCIVFYKSKKDLNRVLKILKNKRPITIGADMRLYQNHINEKINVFNKKKKAVLVVHRCISNYMSITNCKKIMCFKCRPNSAINKMMYGR